MTREITIELSKEELGIIDDMIDGREIKSREQAIGFIISNYLTKFSIKNAFILAGGKGTRMRPFTYEIPKALIPVKGKPLLQHILELLRKYEIRDVILSIGYLGHKIKEYFGDGSKFGLCIRYIEEGEELGTAGPLRLVQDSLKSHFLMLNGDVLSDINLHELVRFHFRNKGLATIALTEVEDVSGFGVAEMKGKKILRFIEKPKVSQSKLINAGIYVLNPKVINYIPKGKAMIEKDVFPKLAKEGKLFGYKFKGQWFDTGTHEAYEKVIKEWKGIK
jgi:NDP-sugar pyrophosphorylase family protein